MFHRSQWREADKWVDPRWEHINERIEYIGHKADHQIPSLYPCLQSEEIGIEHNCCHHHTDHNHALIQTNQDYYRVTLSSGHHKLYSWHNLKRWEHIEHILLLHIAFYQDCKLKAQYSSCMFLEHHLHLGCNHCIHFQIQNSQHI